MKFQIEDIDYSKITPHEFENLCYDLLVKYNYRNLIWREGGADNGRDIEATMSFSTMILEKETKWFFECKHYTSGGVPPNDLSSKIAWADAEQPDYLILFISSYLTNNARTWLDKIKSQKTYAISVLEGEELKNRILKYPELVERYFSLNRYEKLLKDIIDYKTKFRINPSYDFLVEIIDNVDLSRLTKEEIAFLLINYYSQFASFEGRNEYHGDFSGNEPDRILKYIKKNEENELLASFEPYYNDYDYLGGTGFMSEMEWLDDEEFVYDMKDYNFQCSDFHLNHLQAQDKWKIGYYLFVIFEDIGIEVFQSDKTEIRIIKDLGKPISKLLSIKLDKEFDKKYKRYCDWFKK
jgi:hypothetical protein